MSKKDNVLITGASSGIGRATAELLARRGYSVFGTSRDPVGSEEVPGAELLPLDVRSDESVSRCVEAVMAKAGRVDVLVNNAAYMLFGALEESSLEDAKAQFETNFFGAVRMVNAVLPQMRQRRFGRIINISSAAADFALPFEGYYSASKTALSLYTEGLRQELTPMGISASIILPGFFRTLFEQNKAIAITEIADYQLRRDRFARSYGNYFVKGGNPSKVALCVLKIIESSVPRLRYRVGWDSYLLGLRRFLPDSLMLWMVRVYFKI